MPDRPYSLPGIPAIKLGYKDSNLEMTESESVALPFGDTPTTSVIIRHNIHIVNTFFRKNLNIFYRKIFVTQTNHMDKKERIIYNEE